jgi:hypothetical protein
MGTAGMAVAELRRSSSRAPVPVIERGREAPSTLLLMVLFR